jgi:hypothetical protein
MRPLHELFGFNDIIHRVLPLMFCRKPQPKVVYGVSAGGGEGWRPSFGEPWLLPAFAAHLPGIKQALRKMLTMSLKDLGKT